ncbi:MAG: hypothetical protein VYD87_19880, partial [Pseudomonadota bacterium]|nr:hypothetical protein [Pseudomonadota bacterium]
MHRARLVTRRAASMAARVRASLETLAIPGDPFPVTLQRDASGYSVAETGADFLAAYTGATWHVSPSGNDTTGDGSSGAPYATIGKAVTEASALDRIQL